MPDHVDSSVIESASSKNTDAVPSTEKTERRGGMVGVVKPSCHKVKLQDVVRPPDIQIVKPVNSSSDITTPTMPPRRSVFSVDGTASVFLLEADSITELST
jgi:hypothetical protein